MLNRLPKFMPSFEEMLGDIGNPSTRELARALGVSERTVRRWQSTGRAPRTAMLAVFWLTRWGMSAADCEAHNQAVLYAGWVRTLAAESELLRARITRLAGIADFGCANDPIEIAATATREALRGMRLYGEPGFAQAASDSTGGSTEENRPINRATA